ncbi:hypothetical protein J5893_03325 [bacterium]|nr:hypothetical protein [bacterium]
MQQASQIPTPQETTAFSPDAIFSFENAKIIQQTKKEEVLNAESIFR